MKKLIILVCDVFLGEYWLLNGSTRVFLFFGSQPLICTWHSIALCRVPTVAALAVIHQGMEVYVIDLTVSIVIP